MVNAKIQPETLDRLVAIIFYGRSGSMFLASLLDGHPKTVSTPGTYLDGFYKHSAHLPGFWDTFGHLPSRELARVFMEYYAVFFDAGNSCQCPVCGPNVGKMSGFTRMGSDRDQVLRADREVFSARLLDIIGQVNNTSRRLFLQAVHIAYQEAIGRSYEANPLIVFPLHSPVPMRAEKLIGDFPNTMFLHIVRHPIRSLGSHFAHYFTQGKKDNVLMMALLGDMLSGGIPLASGYASSSRAVKLEDLHSYPRKTMEKVCCWLDLKWNETLLKSTFDGIQWWNLSGSPQISGFSQATISQTHEKYISSFDEFRLSILAAAVFRAWHYPLPTWYSSLAARVLVMPLLFIPLKIELLSMVTPSMSWRSIYSTFKGLFRGRRVLLRAWLATFRARPAIIELLE